jgi:REP element-mobilizing transposase RayT
MGQTLVQLYIHIIFSTKNREPLIPQALDDALYAYIGGVIKEKGGFPILINGVADHVHLLTTLPKTVSISDYVRDIKANASWWLKTQDAVSNGFSWQSGYGAFSVSASQKNTVFRYVANQKEHHKKVSFQEEFLKFLKRYNIPYDERYIWQ